MRDKSWLQRIQMNQKQLSLYALTPKPAEQINEQPLTVHFVRLEQFLICGKKKATVPLLC